LTSMEIRKIENRRKLIVYNLSIPNMVELNCKSLFIHFDLFLHIDI